MSLVDLEQLAEEAGVPLFFPDQPTADTPAGRMQRRMSAVFASYQTDQQASVLPLAFAMARNAHGDYRRRMAHNFLLTAGAALECAGAIFVDKLVIKATVRLVYEMARLARAESLSDGMNDRVFDIRGVAAYSLAHAGMLLEDAKLLHRSMRRLLKAASKRPMCIEGHWENALVLLNALFRRNDDWRMVRTWADKLLALAEANAGDDFMNSYDTLKNSGKIDDVVSYYGTNSTTKTIVQSLDRRLAKSLRALLAAAILLTGAFVSSRLQARIYEATTASQQVDRDPIWNFGSILAIAGHEA
jgi:hypothetical protein